MFRQKIGQSFITRLATRQKPLAFYSNIPLFEKTAKIVDGHMVDVGRVIPCMGKLLRHRHASAKHMRKTHAPLRKIGERDKGLQAFVSFPNFAQWRMRLAHMFGGRMPVTEQLPHTWYDTPNIHHVTIDDFRSFLEERNIRIEGQWFLSGGKPRNERLANLLAEHAVFLLRRD